MRTLDPVLEDALANQKGNLILRVLTWVDQAAYNAAPTVPDHTWIVKKFDIGSTSASAELVTENDYTASNFSVFIIERGVTFAGVEYTIQSGLMFVRNYQEDYGTIKIIGSSYPNQKISIAAGDETYQQVITAFCTAIGKTAVFKNVTDAWLNYQFLPAGKALSLNKAELFESLLKQKYCILVFEESPNKLNFYNLDSYVSSALKAIADNGSMLITVATAGKSKGFSTSNSVDWKPLDIPNFYNDITYSQTLGLWVGVGASVAGSSPNGENWTARNIPAGTYNAILWSNTLSLFIAIGTNICATSPDGTTWTERTISARTFKDITQFENTLIATGTKTISSTSGITWAEVYTNFTWTARAASEANQWQAVAWSPELSLFVAVSIDGTNRVMTSPDGITWTARAAAEANTWRAIAWSPALNLFAALSAGGTNRVMTSPDGITWTARAASEANQWKSVTWSPALSLFVAVSADGTFRVMTSPDGINWTARVASEENNWTSVAWSPELSLLVAVGTFGANRVMTSSDGINWTTRTASEANNWASVTWSPGLNLFVAVSGNGTNRVMTSPDGITWTAHAAAEANNWINIAWSPESNIFVAISTDGTNRVMTSPDGITWTAHATAEANFWYATAWSPELNLFAAVGATGTNRVMTWELLSDLNAITNNGAIIVIVGNNKCLTSPNGITWTERTIPAGVYNGVTFGNSLFVAVGTNKCATSPDGITWTARTITNNAWQDVLYSTRLSLFVAIADSGSNRITTSSDGINWSVRRADADFSLSYLDGTTSHIIRDQKSVHFLWRDEAATLHTEGDTTLPQWNLGYLKSTDSAPTTHEDAYYKIFLQKAPVRLDITDGDKIHFTPYWSIDPTKTIDAMMQVSEHLDLKKSPSWYQEIKSIIMFNATEGGALPSTIERVAAYTPLVSTGFDGNLDPSVNNLQAFAQAVDDMTIGGSAPVTDAANDFQVGNGAGTWIKNTLAQVVATLRTSLDSVFAPIAKGVTNGDSHNHSGGDGAQIAYSGLSGIPSMAYGEAVLAANFTLNQAAGTMQDTGLYITLPTSGIYLILADVYGTVKGNAGSAWFLAGKFYNSTDGVDITNSERLLIYAGVTAQTFGGVSHISKIVTVNASKVIKLYACRNGSGSPSWLTSLIGSTSDRKTMMSFIQIMG